MRDKSRTQAGLDRFLRTRELLKLLGISRSTLWEWRRIGHFPAGCQIGPHTLAWRESAVRAWMEER